MNDPHSAAFRVCAWCHAPLVGMAPQARYHSTCKTEARNRRRRVRGGRRRLSSMTPNVPGAPVIIPAITLTCRTCGKPFLHVRQGVKYCSRECCPSVRKRQALRVAAYLRDGKKCVRCAATRTLLIRTLPGKARTLENVVTLCRKCNSAVSREAFWERWPKGREGYLGDYKRRNPRAKPKHSARRDRPGQEREVVFSAAPVGLLIMFGLNDEGYGGAIEDDG